MNTAGYDEPDAHCLAQRRELAQHRARIEARLSELRGRFAQALTGIGSMAGDPNGEILALEKELRKIEGKYNPIVDQ